MRQLLKMLGWEIVYGHRWGVWKYRYSNLDYVSGRPIHRNMRVAPPGSKMIIRRIQKTG